MLESEIRKRYMIPFYMQFLHGDFCKYPADIQFHESVRSVAHEITDEDIQFMLGHRNWRERSCGAWFAGMKGRTQFMEAIGQLLKEVFFPWSVEGYCIALGIFGGPRAESILANYLANNLPLKRGDDSYTWPLGALAYVRRSTPLEFMDDALWTVDGSNYSPQNAINKFDECMNYLKRYDLLNLR